MSKLITTVIIIISITISGITQHATLDKGQSSLKWTGNAAYSSYNLSGTLEPQKGHIEINGEYITKSEITIDMSTLDAENKDLKKHLRSKDFFHVKNYETASFYTTSPIKLKTGITTISGVIIIKDVSREIEVEVNVKKVKEGWRIMGVLVLNRTEFGIKYNSPSFFDNLKDQAIADTFELEFDFFFQ